MDLVKKVEKFVEESFMKCNHKSEESKKMNITHAKNTLEWVERLYPQADIALRVAALGHDIDRAYVNIDDEFFFKNQKLRKLSYDSYKKEHAIRGARHIFNYLEKRGASRILASKVRELIEAHETGGSFDSEILKYADAISFIDNNFDRYLRRYGKKKALFKLNWTYNRLRNTSQIEKKTLNLISKLYKNKMAEFKTS